MALRDELAADLVPVAGLNDVAVLDQPVEPEAVLAAFGAVESVNLLEGKIRPGVVAPLAESNDPAGGDLSFYIPEGAEKVTIGVDMVGCYFRDNRGHWKTSKT